jgi:hypothetical protein
MTTRQGNDATTANTQQTNVKAIRQDKIANTRLRRQGNERLNRQRIDGTAAGPAMQGRTAREG